MATSAQLRAVKKLLEPKNMGLPDTAYMGRKLAKTQGTGDLVEPRSWPKLLRFMIDQILEQRE